MPLLLAVLLMIWFVSGAFAQMQMPLPGKNIPKYVNTISPAAGSNLGVYDATAGGNIPVTMSEAKAMILPSTVVLPIGTYTGTWTWQYSIPGTVYPAVPGGRDTYLGPVILAQRGNPVNVTYENNLGYANSSQVLFYASSLDQTLHWADPYCCMMGNCNRFLNYTGRIPAVVHLHGGEVESRFDGGPDSWFTADALEGATHDHMATYNAVGPAFTAANPFTKTYYYPNGQEAAPIWYHDHTLGATRLNVYAGLAGGYLIQDPPGIESQRNLPPPVPIVIQDRIFDTNGQLYFPALGLNPMVHPFWLPEFFGDTIVVNGKAWPRMTVEARRYRFVFLNGSNARFYELSLGRNAPPFWVIGTDGGYLAAPVPISFPNRLLIAPGERYEVIIDFTGLTGSIFTVTNTAKAPYPKGVTPDPQTVGQIMQFSVGAVAADTTCNPAVAAGPGSCTLRPGTTLQQLVNFTTGALMTGVNQTRQLTLNEVMGMGGPLEILVNNTKWDGKNAAGPIPGSVLVGANYVTELPRRGSTEIWEVVNLTADAHPIHLHLVQFQLISRQNFNVSAYNKAYAAVFPGGVSPVDGLTYPAGVFIPGFGPPLNYLTGTLGKLGGNPDAALFLQGKPTTALPYERGWKDTVIMYPGQVTRIAVRWAPTDALVGSTTAGTEAYPFDSTSGPGYVWHCHIIDHEDNEMMRPYAVAP